MRGLLFLSLAACTMMSSGTNSSGLGMVESNVSQARLIMNGEEYDLGSLRADWSLLTPDVVDECDASYMLYLDHEGGLPTIAGTLEVPVGFLDGVEATATAEQSHFAIGLDSEQQGSLSGGTLSWEEGAEYVLSILGSEFCNSDTGVCETVDVELVLSNAPAEAQACLRGVDVGMTDDAGGVPCGFQGSVEESPSIEVQCPVVYEGTP